MVKMKSQTRWYRGHLTVLDMLYVSAQQGRFLYCAALNLDNAAMKWGAVVLDSQTLQDLHELERLALAQFSAAQSSAELEQRRVEIFGKKGSLTIILKSMGSLSPEERPVIGKSANEVRMQLDKAFSEYKAKLETQELQARLEAEKLDISLPSRVRPYGAQHLINKIKEDMIECFVGLGYRVYDGPQVETDFYNFTALNTPEDHPARGMQDTFYVKDLSGQETRVQGESQVLLRTQTSGVQIHTMEQMKPPIFMIAPGRVYRRDVADPSHLPMFNQLEGLVVDKGISFADMKGTIEYFLTETFGKDRKVRFRPHFFPFTEPSAEVDVSCGVCKGEGCRFCKGVGWIEVMGCGMVDPHVFGFVHLDPQEYSGFAFGMGIERIAALKYDLPDLRMLLEGDMRFLRQF